MQLAIDLDQYSALMKERILLKHPVQLCAGTNASIKAFPPSLRRRGARIDSTRSPQSLQHGRERTIRIRQTRAARRRGPVDGRAVALSAVPKDLLDIAELQDFGNQRADVGGHGRGGQRAAGGRGRELRDPDGLVPRRVQLRDLGQDALGIRVVDVHGDCVELVDAAVAGLEKLAEPRAVGVHEGWRDELGVRVRCVEEDLEIGRGGSSVFGQGQVFKGEVGLVVEFEVWRRAVCQHFDGGVYVGVVHDDGDLAFVEGAVELRCLSGGKVVIGLLVESFEGEADCIRKVCQ